ncbi:MAG TPA: glycosyltransferase family 39 protein [Anaerolineaceae bacterium]|nr:glycosyltransferase family 39 protein [Anaerolineaceae bacterium]
MKKLSITARDFIFSVMTALVISLVMAAFQPKPFFSAWYGTWLLLGLSLFLGLKVWRFFGGGRQLAVLLIVAFFVRFLLGFFVYTALPQIGFNKDVENAGYSYSDAYLRDIQALEWAQGNEPLIKIFTSDTSIDQYGGLQYITASLYRYFSVDEPRPLFTTILAALAMSAGLAFLYDAIKHRWGAQIALVAAWFYALYPEGVLLGSTQMREPFLIGFFCIAFWAAVNWRQNTRQKMLYFLLPMATSVVISRPFGVILAGLLLMYGFIDWLSEQKTPQTRKVGFMLIALAGVAALVAGYMWVKPTIYYDAFMTRASSGNMTVLLDRMGEKWHIPFITFYGLTQPFLPGALTDPSLPFWRFTAIVRALGWWYVIPFFLYGFFAVWKAKPRANRWVLVFIVMVLSGWMVVSSIRAGGDLWDNPRYRALLIPWFALLVGWCWQRIRSGHLVWFLRWVGVELVFFIVFYLWYMYRYQVIKEYIGFFDMIRVTIAASGLIILTGLLWDGYKWLKARKVTARNGGSGSVS